MSRWRWSAGIGALVLGQAAALEAAAQTPSQQMPEAPVGAAAPATAPAGSAAESEGASPEVPAPAATAEPEAEKPSPAQGDDAVWAVAKRYLRQGEALFEAGNFEAALTEFEKAYEHMEGHPKRFYVLDNIGMCHERLFRYDLALQYFQRFLDEGGADAPDRAAVEASIRALKGLLATLTVSANVKAEVWVDDRLMGEAPGDVLLPGGRHVIELRAPGHEPVQREIHITARETQTQSFTLDPIEEYEGLSPVFFWTGAALTVGTAAVGGFFGLRALSQDSDGEERRDSLGAMGNTPEDEDEVKRSALTADILYGAAALFAVGTTLVYFMTDWDDPPGSERGPESSQARTAWVPLADQHTLGLGLRGSF